MNVALESLFTQILKPAEVIVVDDGSDNPVELLELIENFRSKLNIRLIRNESSIGQARSRNLGANHAISSYLAFLDDDNRFYPDHIELCVSTIKKYNLDAVASFMNQTFKNDVLSLNDEINQVAIFAGQQFKDLNSLFNLVCDTHILVNKAKSSQEDWGLGLRLLADGAKFGSTGKPTIHYRINNDGVYASRSSLGLANWWPLHTSKLGHSSWIIPELARLGLRQSLSQESVKRVKYFKYGLLLLKNRDFSTLYSGVKRYLKS